MHLPFLLCTCPNTAALPRIGAVGVLTNNLFSTIFCYGRLAVTACNMKPEISKVCGERCKCMQPTDTSLLRC
ncbi:hypothetical protein DFJ58DRAFT_780417 [Suillus subalutaceus]|uniref:uncharacterized protein n=1 Tax=Suillus subalutaceus TaxID=48586 RepID=UPI001B86ABC3|nr:uncharacterized protein DFJ58DRAFT_780417 [Suillus subalutaceus]KAG1859599.1 hypothetical protein DFJ58DRAFT_780417 [Suillus subalutaceus]